jgi:hypothetical protein
MIVVDVDSTEVQRMLRSLSDSIADAVAGRAVSMTATQLKRSMSNEARSAGFGKVSNKRSKSGWEWETLGRMPRAVQVSKFFRTGRGVAKGDKGKKIFLARGRKYLYTNRMPHAHLIIAGYRQMIPTGLPGVGQVRPSQLKPFHPGRDVFSASPKSAKVLLTRNLRQLLRKKIKESAK